MSAKSPTFSKSHKKSNSTHSKPIPPLSKFASASTFMHGIQSISFPKASRLDSLHDSSAFSNVTSPRPISFKSKRSTSFGYGQKQCLPPCILRNARELPGANAYTIPGQFEALFKAKTFGVGRECFEKTYIPGMDHLPLGMARELPGPGQYEIQRKPKMGFSIVGKGNGFNRVMADEGPLRMYHPNLDLVEPGRFKKIGFGFGKRGNFTERKGEGPGPGTYEAVGIFAKYNKRHKF